MIIPPDTEKDATLFSPNSSTPSLLLPPSDDGEHGESDINVPPRAHTRSAGFGYIYGSSQDDLGVAGYTHNGDALPPYDRNESPTPHMRERNRRSVTRPHISIPPTPGRSSQEDLTPRASTSTAYLPRIETITPSASTTAVSTSKLWEGSETSSLNKPKWSIDLTPKWRKWWLKWRMWIYIGIALFLAGIGLMTGLLVGMNEGKKETNNADVHPKPWKDISGDGKRQSTWVSTGELLNLTYVPSRDGPSPQDGNITSCPPFTLLNSSSPINLLSRPFPAVSSSIARFEIALDKNLSTSTLQVLPDFAFIARGLGSSGTVEIVGSDAPEEVRQMGKEGVMVINVVALYSGPQELDTIVRVCQLSRGDEGIGLGIFTPQETDGKVSNAYILNPTSLPSFHVVIHLPPSALLDLKTASVAIPKIEYQLDRMAVRFGNMKDIVEFGKVRVNSFRGGVQAVYIAAETVDIRTGENTVKGRFNISESIAINQTEGNILTELILHRAYNSSDIAINQTTSNGSAATIDARAYLGNQNGTTLDDGDSPRGPEGQDRQDEPDLEPQSQYTIRASFMTAEGILAAAYLEHPSNVKLSSLFINGQGDTVVSLHPNFIGSYIVKDVWGQVRVANPDPLWDSDPAHQGRSRATSFGLIDIQEDSVYGENGLNSTILEDSLVALSGVVYWKDNKTLTPSEVMELDGAVSEVLISNAWGDVQLGLDGKR